MQNFCIIKLWDIALFGKINKRDKYFLKKTYIHGTNVLTVSLILLVFQKHVINSNKDLGSGFLNSDKYFLYVHCIFDFSMVFINFTRIGFWWPAFPGILWIASIFYLSTVTPWLSTNSNILVMKTFTNFVFFFLLVKYCSL